MYAFVSSSEFLKYYKGGGGGINYAEIFKQGNQSLGVIDRPKQVNGGLWWGGPFFFTH